MITFNVQPHSADSAVEVIEVFQGDRLLAVIYPGTGPDDRHANAIRIDSCYFAGGPKDRFEARTAIVRFTDG